MATATLSPQFPLAPYKSLSNDELSARIDNLRGELGKQLLVLGQHHQQDAVSSHADMTGERGFQRRSRATQSHIDRCGRKIEHRADLFAREILVVPQHDARCGRLIQRSDRFIDQPRGVLALKLIGIIHAAVRIERFIAHEF